MKAINRWLEANGQEPRTFARDAVFFLVRFYVIIFIVLLPMSLLTFALKPAGSADTTTPARLPLQYLLLIVPFGLYLFCAVVTALSLIGGWYKLARSFRAPTNFTDGRLFTWQSARVGPVSYNNILKIGVAPQGLYLACPFPFRLMHPPLLIPWHKIKVLRKNTHIFGRVSVLLSIGEPKLATILLVNKKLLQAAAPWLPEVNP